MVNLYVVDCPSGDFVEVECECGYFLGYVKRQDLIPTGKPMFECPSCKQRFDIVKRR